MCHCQLRNWIDRSEAAEATCNNSRILSELAIRNVEEQILKFHEWKLNAI